jgi:hypothetical protein
MGKRTLSLCVLGLWLVFACGALLARGHADGASSSTQTAAPAQTPTTLEDKPVEEVYKNIQVLKGVPRSQMLTLMNNMRAALGVRCDYCHALVQFKGFEKDDKQTKLIARKHIQMTSDINKANFGGQPVVTCNTCHRGQPRPVAVPAIGQAAFKDQVVADPASVKPAETLPTVEQVLSKYEQALGGRAAIEHLKTRTLKGSYVDWDGTTVPLEVYQKAPNKFLSLITLPGGRTAYRSYNGTAAWDKNFRGLLREVRGPELALFTRSADLLREVRLRELYPKMSVIGKEKVGEREVYVVEASAADNQIERLYFDTQTGLLLRRYVENATILGPDPEQIDFEDYRDVDGVKLPFLVRVSNIDTFNSYTRRITEVKHGVPVEDKVFDMPPAPAAPAATPKP